MTTSKNSCGQQSFKIYETNRVQEKDNKITLSQPRGLPTHQSKKGLELLEIISPPQNSSKNN
jgi:hypothetical protein